MSVTRIAHEGGSPEGTNSAYLLPDRGVLIDPGPPGEGAWETLRNGITDTCSLDSIDHVLLTHWHADHAGLASRLAEAAGAVVHMHEADAPLVGEYARERKRRLARDERKLREWGVPPDRIATVVGGDRPSPFPFSYPVRAHADGERVAGLDVIHTPGHTLGHAAFRTGSFLFVGDAVLGTYTPNVGGSDTRVEDALSTYFETLRRLRGIGERAERAKRAYPGHGGALDHAARIDEILAHHERRSAAVLASLDKEGSTPWTVATRLFGEMRGIHVKMGAGEAGAHLARLASDGEVERVASAPLRYRSLADHANDSRR